MLDRLEAGQVVFGEAHTAPRQLADGGADVLDLEADGGVRGLRARAIGRDRRDISRIGNLEVVTERAGMVK